MIFFNPKKKKIVLIIIFLIIAAIAVYLNRSYAHIYAKIGAAGLKFPEQGGIYMINDDLTTNKGLIYAALGDSLTAGVGTDSPEETLPYLLAQGLGADDKKVVLKNLAVPGARTSDVINVFLPEAIEAQPDVVTLLIGVNDIHNHVSVTQFRKNYEEILSRLSKETKATIYIINIPFIGASDLMLPPYQCFFDSRTKEFNKIIKELANQYEIKYIDLYSPTVNLFKQSGAHYSRDSFHPSAAGYKLWAEIIYAGINK
jgi:lysophospholipase L1-like esterase